MCKSIKGLACLNFHIFKVWNKQWRNNSKFYSKFKSIFLINMHVLTNFLLIKCGWNITQHQAFSNIKVNVPRIQILFIQTCELEQKTLRRFFSSITNLNVYTYSSSCILLDKLGSFGSSPTYNTNKTCWI